MKRDVLYLSGDDLWLDAGEGWYVCEILDDSDNDESDIGDTEGPYDSEEEAFKAMSELENKA